MTIEVGKYRLYKQESSSVVLLGEEQYLIEKNDQTLTFKSTIVMFSGDTRRSRTTNTVVFDSDWIPLKATIVTGDNDGKLQLS